ncbi:hypothetical protein HII36_37760 [Nonomuraea sp. NN258]|uniref:hypothetical protein n=1 Tax=Nonomuraea antri TaxID=2730852 RepID=UPI00156977B0|nr:hypothetical protein [Nonomuraea antri]NRQ37538.1 hypothetical protein [Nonomuraea antri]
MKMTELRRARETRRPGSVTIAVVLQLLTVIPFVVGILVVLVHGDDAQAAAEAEIARQGFSPDILARHGISFGGSEAPAIVLVLVLLALVVLNLAGKRIGRILSWIFQPVLFAMGIVIIPGQLFTAQFLASSFRESGDATLMRIDAQALVDAAMQAMPAWLTAASAAKLVLTTLGSVFVVVLLALPSARAYFRKA